MSKHIILFGAGKSATTLIQYLTKTCGVNGWRLTVADSNINAVLSKTGSFPHVAAKQVQVENADQRSGLVKEGDLVISLLPPSLHFLVARDCITFGKDLLTASYLDDKIQSLGQAVKSEGLLFLCEMGLDPGIDHMSAMRLIHGIKNKGGKILSFKSHCGGLLAPESDDNPWHYKISWNPRNIVRAGAAGASFVEDNVTHKIEYRQLFEHCKTVMIKDAGQLAQYPNRDSLPYMKLYGLEDAATFIRTTLRHPGYCTAWNGLVNASLTNDTITINEPGMTFKDWSAPLTSLTNSTNNKQFEFLGLFDNDPIPTYLNTSADILQYLLEKKLMMQTGDKDMIIMLHELEFILDNSLHKTDSLLMLKGDDSINTAMAKTVGLPLGIAATLILKGKISLTGLHIPVIPEIYEPVLHELEKQGIIFEENDFV